MSVMCSSGGRGKRVNVSNVPPAGQKEEEGVHPTIPPGYPWWSYYPRVYDQPSLPGWT